MNQSSCISACATPQPCFKIWWIIYSAHWKKSGRKDEIIVYMDDILIAMSTSLQDHRDATHDVLDLLQEHNLFLKKKKCRWEVNSIDYLGLILEKGVTHMDPTKVEGIKKWPRPAKVKDIRSFLGFHNFYHPLIPSLLWNNPHFLLLYFMFVNSFPVMWSSCDHIVTHCSCDGYCSITSIVLWPIVQGDSIVPVTPIVPVTLLFSFTISIGPIASDLTFVSYGTDKQSESFPHSHPLSSPSQDIRSKASDCLIGYHSHQKLSKSSLDLVIRTRTLLFSVPVNDLAHVGWTSLLWRNKASPKSQNPSMK